VQTVATWPRDAEAKRRSGLIDSIMCDIEDAQQPRRCVAVAKWARDKELFT